MSLPRQNKRKRVLFEGNKEPNPFLPLNNYPQLQQTDDKEEQAEILPSNPLPPLNLYPLPPAPYNIESLIQLLLSVQNAINMGAQAENNQMILANLPSQIKNTERCLRTIQDDRQYDKRIYDQIKQQFLIQQSAAEITKTVSSLNNQLEINWQKQRERELEASKLNEDLALLLIKILETETLANQDWTAAYRFHEIAEELRIEIGKRVNERKEITDKIANQLLSDPKMLGFAQQMNSFSFPQMILMLYQQIPTPAMQMQPVQQIVQEQSVTQLPSMQPQLNTSQPINFLQPMQEKRQQEASRQRALQSQPKLTANLSVNLSKELAFARTRTNFPLASPLLLNSKITDVSQENLIFRMNEYLSSKNLPKISEEGYCHGIDLAWILMDDWGLKDAYTSIVETIARYQPYQSHKVGPLILFFLRLIKLGQNPEKYSNGTCTQQDLPTLFGNVDAVFSFDGYFTKEELKIELRKRITPNSKPKIAIQGFGTHKRTGKSTGHTVSVVTLPHNHNYKYKFHDSNYRTKKETYLNSIDEIVEEAWKQIFTLIDGGEKPRIIINAVKSQPKPSWLIELAGFFSHDKKLVEAIVGAPVREEKAQAQEISIPNWQNTI